MQPDRKPQTPNPYPKADFLHRVVARFADVVIAILLGRMLPGVVLGPVVGIAYLLLADGIFMGQSPGKKLGGVKVVNTRYHRDAAYRESALRNLPFALVGIFAIIPIIGHYFLLPLGGLFVFAFETYMSWTDRFGLRVGDVLADTQVVDASVPIENPEAVERVVEQPAVAEATA